MEKQLIRFKESRIKEAIDPVSKVVRGIELLEQTLYEGGYIDSSFDTMLISSYHMTYRKNGQDIMIIYPAKTDWSIKLLGNQWSIHKLFHLSVSFNFEWDRIGWRLSELVQEDIEKLKDAIVDATISTPLEKLVRYPLTILYAYQLKSMSLSRQYSEDILEDVVSLYWDGQFAKIRDIYVRYQPVKQSKIMDFVEGWFEKINIAIHLDEKKLDKHMFINEQEVHKVSSVIRDYIQVTFLQYQKSLTNIWLNLDLIKDEDNFLSAINQARSTIMTVDNFLHEWDELDKTNISDDNHKQPETEEVKREGTVVHQNAVSADKKQEESKSKQFEKAISVTKKEEEEDWFQFFIASQQHLKINVPFRSRKDLFDYPTSTPLIVDEKRVRALATKISKERRNEKELTLLIKLLVQFSNQEGYVTKEKLKQLFVNQYDAKDLEGFSMRYGVSKRLALQSLRTIFHRFIEQLKTAGLVKEFFRKSNQNPDGAYEMYWNFAIYVYKE